MQKPAIAVRKQDELHEMWRYSSLDGDVAPDAMELLKRKVEQRLKMPFMRKLTVPSTSPLASSRSGSSIGASCVLPCPTKQAVLCALRCGCLCILNASHAHKEFLFHESSSGSGTNKSAGSKASSGAAAGSSQSGGGGGGEKAEDRIARKRSELTAVAARSLAAPASTPLQAAASAAKPIGSAAVAAKPGGGSAIAAKVGGSTTTAAAAAGPCMVFVACVLGTGLYLFDLDVMAATPGPELRSKPKPIAELPFADSTVWYKSASVHFYASKGMEARPLMLVALHAEGGGVVVGIFQRTGAKAADYATRLAWSPLPLPAGDLAGEAAAPSVVVFGFIATDMLLLLAVNGTLVLVSVQNTMDEWGLAVVGTLSTGPAPITHGAMLLAASCDAAAGAGGGVATTHLVLVHGKGIVQSCTLAVRVKRLRSEGTPSSPKSGRSSSTTTTPVVADIAATMHLTLCSSFATHEVAVHDVELQAPVLPDVPATVLVFAALETGAVVVLDFAHMRLVQRIPYKRLEVSARLRLNVWQQPLLLGVMEDENASVYKAEVQR